MRPSRSDPSISPIANEPLSVSKETAESESGPARTRVVTVSPLSRRNTRNAPSDDSAQAATRYSSVPTRNTRAAAGTVRSDSRVACPDLSRGMATLSRNRNTPETARIVPTPPTEMQAAAMRSAALTVHRVPWFRVRGRSVI